MPGELNYVISIAGFDPSAGAGILADIKTFEQLQVYGLGVCSAITVQTEDAFHKVIWVSLAEILEQLEILLKKYAVSFLKIGLIESFDVLEEILLYLKENFPAIKVIWDPVLIASAGYRFHHTVSHEQVLSISKDLFLITPNAEEIRMLMNMEESLSAAQKLAAITAIFLKSRKSEDGIMHDVLIHHSQQVWLESKVIEEISKHGSGCVLSAAITAFLAKGNDLPTSCALAKEYTFEFLKSTEGLLGNHYRIKHSLHHA